MTKFLGLHAKKVMLKIVSTCLSSRKCYTKSAIKYAEKTRSGVASLLLDTDSSER